ncbi:MAG: DUF1343 domain-containing protein [Turneriella sp.]|nr:DUF1343 domain-containing protein [Turneriella sp.]
MDDKTTAVITAQKNFRSIKSVVAPSLSRNAPLLKRTTLFIFIIAALFLPSAIPAKRRAAKRNKSAAEIFFAEGLKRLRGKETCFITNASGLGRYFLYDAMEETDKYIGARLAKHDIRLAHLFTPEHGLTGQEDDHGNTKLGKAAAQKNACKSSSDEPAACPAVTPETIYLTTVEKLQEKISDCEAIVFDLPDSGVRPYTYRTVLNRIMRAMDRAAKNQLLYLIDVPNPASHLGPLGVVAQKTNFSYVGEEEIPFMPGFTHAEIARKFIADYKLKIRIHIQKMAGYKPATPHSKRGLVFYPPSPNLPHLRANQCYWISVFFEATSIEEGRITKDPFCQIGHPEFANGALPVMGGVKFQPYPFFAHSGKHKGKLLAGYKLEFSETKVDPPRAAYEFFLWYVKHGQNDWLKNHLTEKQGLDAQTGSTTLRKALLQELSYDEFIRGEKKRLAAFVAAMEKYKLYK